MQLCLLHNEEDSTSRTDETDLQRHGAIRYVGEDTRGEVSARVESLFRTLGEGPVYCLAK